MVLASKPVVSVIRLAARPVGAQSSSVDVLGGEDAQDGLDDGRLADARAAGDDQDLGGQGQADCLASGLRLSLSRSAARSRVGLRRRRSRAKAACPGQAEAVPR